jgi:hypothetical protein
MSISGGFTHQGCSRSNWLASTVIKVRPWHLFADILPSRISLCAVVSIGRLSYVEFRLKSDNWVQAFSFDFYDRGHQPHTIDNQCLPNLRDLEVVSWRNCFAWVRPKKVVDIVGHDVERHRCALSNFTYTTGHHEYHGKYYREQEGPLAFVYKGPRTSPWT